MAKEMEICSITSITGNVPKWILIRSADDSLCQCPQKLADKSPRVSDGAKGSSVGQHLLCNIIQRQPVNHRLFTYLAEAVFKREAVNRGLMLKIGKQ